MALNTNPTAAPVPKRELQRRRTFAIVSHPDAGKTTLTEKLLLYGGALGLAGSVTARKNQRATTSDWMELEKKRGISISSTVLQFEYEGYCINLLDTPGHKDFSEDTYRVLSAVDAAVMVIDAGKGIEDQTRKLFEVCRQRGVPIFTFMNKLDRPARNPLELLDELESVLGISAYPMNWPLGTGSDFAGVWDRQTKLAYLYERTPGGAYRAPEKMATLTDPLVREKLNDEAYRTVCEEVELLDGAGVDFQRDEVLAGRTTPVYFGSALNNFGVQLLIDGFLKHSTPPTPRQSAAGPVDPAQEGFSGFVFKIQSNMNPRHRDQVAFVRIVSGRFVRDLNVTHVQTGKKVRLGNVIRSMGQGREVVEEAFPGDVLGIVGKIKFSIGDTLSEDPDVLFNEIPCFAPECFAYLENPTPVTFKQFRNGLSQLIQEGVVQGYEVDDAVRKVPLLGAVGPLQFEVMQYRLETEYGAKSIMRPAPWTVARWLEPSAQVDPLDLPSGAQLATDTLGRKSVLFTSEWSMNYFQEKSNGFKLSSTPFPAESDAKG